MMRMIAEFRGRRLVILAFGGLICGSVLFLLTVRMIPNMVNPEIEEPHPWWHYPSRHDSRASLWERIDSGFVYQVSQEHWDEAIAALESKPVMQLEEDLFEKYTKRRVNGDAKYKAFLIRALTMKGFVGNFQLRLQQDALWVRFGYMGRGGNKLTKTPLIVTLESQPRSVYVTVSGAL